MGDRPRTGTATVLFTDLVGSTALRTSLGEERAEDLRRTHDRLLAQAVSTWNGRLVKNLGDGIMAVFSSAADALSAAVAIQQMIEAHGRRTGRPSSAVLAIRVGISVGDVSWEEDDCFGVPVVEASRLCAAASAGQILASAVVPTIARGRGGHSCSPVGDLTLRGLPEPVPACEVVWAPALVGDGVDALPLPMALGAGPLPFVGRSLELDRLTRMWHEAARGRRQVGLIAGEPGIGKTRLSAELAHHAHQAGAVVLYGRCDEGLSVPYQPFVEALRSFVAGAKELRAEWLGPYAGELVRLVPDLKERVPGLPAPLRADSEVERYRLFDAVAAWLETSATPGGLVLVLDDLHWAAEPTLLLLRHVVSFSETARLLILGLYRDTDLDRSHPLRGTLADVSRVVRADSIRLEGLDVEAVRALVTEAAGRELDEVAVSLHARTEGSPFFVGEILRHHLEVGPGWPPGAGTSEQLETPEGVRQVVRRRVERLSPATGELLRVAAVHGREFDIGILAPVAARDEDAVVVSLEEAATAGLVDETGVDRYRFAHTLVQATLYDDLSASRRARLHYRVAQELAIRRPRELAALAHHYRQAGPAGDLGETVASLAAAAVQAVEQLAHQDAVLLYRQALEMLDLGPADPALRCQLLVSLGDAEGRAGDPGSRATLLEGARLARRLGNMTQLARAALTKTRTIWSNAGEADLERLDLLEAAVQAVGHGDSGLRARLLGTLAAELVFTADRERPFALSDQAVAIARRLGDAQTLFDVLVARFTVIWVPTMLDERRACVAELDELARRLGNPWAQTLVAGVGYVTNLEAGDIEAAAEALSTGTRLSEELREPTQRWIMASWRTCSSLLAGRLEEGERLMGMAFQLGQEIGQPDAVSWFTCHLYVLCWERGRLGEILAAADIPESPFNRIPTARAALALAYAELDRLDEARSVYEEFASRDFENLPFDLMWITGMAALSEACARLGDKQAATFLYERLSPFGDQLVNIGVACAGSMQRYLGLLAGTLGRHDAAEAHFAAAVETHERIGAPTWLARTQLQWAELLLRRRSPEDAERARGLVEQARATATELGLSSIRRRAELLMAQPEGSALGPRPT